MRKDDRMALLLNLITNLEIERQEDLVELLEDRGLSTTQATISRDIKELGLIKVATGRGTYRYVDADDKRGQTNLTERFVTSVLKQGNMLRIDTYPGATAGIKKDLRIRFSELAFVIINDDDTILIVAKSNEDAHTIYKELKKV